MKETEYKTSKDKLKRFKGVVELNETDICAVGYESPIMMVTKHLASEIAKKTDDTIWEAVVKTEVVVNKEELVKALKYDRERYEKGYRVGYKDAFAKLPWWARKILKRRMGI